jgi:hypothetical protein
MAKFKVFFYLCFRSIQSFVSVDLKWKLYTCLLKLFKLIRYIHIQTTHSQNLLKINKTRRTLWLIIRKRTIRTELQPLISKASVAWSEQRVTTAINRRFLHHSRYSFISVILARLSGSGFRLRTSQKIWQRQESHPAPQDLQPGTLTTRPHYTS